MNVVPWPARSATTSARLANHMMTAGASCVIVWRHRAFAATVAAIQTLQLAVESITVLLNSSRFVSEVETFRLVVIEACLVARLECCRQVLAPIAELILCEQLAHLGRGVREKRRMDDGVLFGGKNARFQGRLAEHP